MGQKDKSIINGDSLWSGITLEELKFRRATKLIQLEMQKDVLARKLKSTLPHAIDSPLGAIGKVTSKMSIMQWILIGYRGSRLVVKAWHKISALKAKFRK